MLELGRYRRADDLAIVSCFFNPAGYRTKWQNFVRFRERVEASGLPMLIVEGAFGDDPFVLDGDGVLRVRCRDVLWQKERLLNLAVAALPRAFTKVAWLDGDLLFEEADWAVETSRLLDERPIVQPFERAIRLPPDAIAYRGTGTVYQSFCAAHASDPAAFLAGDFNVHGHTGFAWAARRELLETCGLYDACLAGSGDHLIAHAALGDWSSPCVTATVGENNRYAAHFAEWAARFYRGTGGRVGFARGTVLHLWHGEMANRRYADRNRELVGYEFDPAADLRVDEAGAWRWSGGRPELREWAQRYFDHRLEDGEKRTA